MGEGGAAAAGGGGEAPSGGTEGEAPSAGGKAPSGGTEGEAPSGGGEAPSGGSGRRRAAALSVLTSYSTTAVGVLTHLALVPLALGRMALADYGAYLAASGLAGSLALLDGGLATVLAPRLARHVGTGDRAAVARTAASGLALGLTAAVAAVVTAALTAPLVPALLRAPATPGLGVAFVAVATGTAAGLAASHFACVLGAYQANGPGLVVTWAALAAGVAVSVLGLAAGGGIRALALGVALRGVVQLVGLAGCVGRLWRRRALPPPRPTAAEARAIATLLAPLALGRAAALLVSQGEPALVAAWQGPATAATVQLTGRAFGVCLTLINPIAGGALAGLAHLAATAPARLPRVLAEIARLSGAVAALTLGTALALDPLFVPAWAGSAAWGGTGLAAAQALAAVLVARGNLLGLALAGLGDVRLPALVALAENLLRLGVLALCSARLGPYAAPVACAIGMGAIQVPLLARALSRRAGASRPAVVGAAPLLAAGALALALALVAPAAPTPAGAAAWAAAAGLALGAVVALTAPLPRRTVVAALRGVVPWRAGGARGARAPCAHRVAR